MPKTEEGKVRSLCCAKGNKVKSDGSCCGRGKWHRFYEDARWGPQRL